MTYEARNAATEDVWYGAWCNGCERHVYSCECSITNPDTQRTVPVARQLPAWADSLATPVPESSIPF